MDRINDEDQLGSILPCGRSRPSFLSYGVAVLPGAQLMVTTGRRFSSPFRPVAGISMIEALTN
jgi:hypothetical protein